MTTSLSLSAATLNHKENLMSPRFQKAVGMIFSIAFIIFVAATSYIRFATTPPSGAETVKPVAIATNEGNKPCPPTPMPTYVVPTPVIGSISTQDAYGFFRHCGPDSQNPWRNSCQDYNYTVHIERVNCADELCEATITFENEYGDGSTMWVDFFDTETSQQIKSGDTILLPSLDGYNWSISSAIPFFEEE
jgi:hypothetical protein